MKKRIRALKAIILVMIMVVELVGADALHVFAEMFQVNQDITVTENSADGSTNDYLMMGGTLTINKNDEAGNPITVGKIYGSGGAVVNYGIITNIDDYYGDTITNAEGATITSVQNSSADITNNGLVGTLAMGSGETVTNAGSIDTLTMGAYTTLNLNGGTITTLGVGEVTDNGDSFNKIVMGGNATIHSMMGTFTISGYGTMQVTGSLNLTGDYSEPACTIAVSDETKITVPSGSKVKVTYGNDTYVLTEGTNQTLRDIEGHIITFNMLDEAAKTLEEMSALPAGKKYLNGEQAVATYRAKEGYYFPENYSISKSQNAGSANVKRIDAKNIEVTVTATGDEDLAFVIPAANAQKLQNAPTGLVGGIGKVSGVTTDMEYAKEADAVDWTSIKELTNDTIAMESGTWYFRYRGTDDKKASVAVPVTVKKEGIANIELEDVYYGRVPSPKVTTTTNVGTKALIQYKKASADDRAYSSIVPTAIGDYIVRVTYGAVGEYGETVTEKKFSIKFLNAPDTAYTLQGTVGNHGYYVSDVIVKPADGYTISTELDGTYVKSLYIRKSQAETKIYLKNEVGAKTGAIRLAAIRIKQEKPKMNLENGKTYYGDSQKLVIQDEYLKQVYVNGILQRLNGSELVVELGSDNGKKQYKIMAVDIAGNIKTIVVTVAAGWMKTGIVPGGVLVNLETGTGYKLGSGNWNVKGDTTSYSGDAMFYVKKDGSYTFQRR